MTNKELTIRQIGEFCTSTPCNKCPIRKWNEESGLHNDCMESLRLPEVEADVLLSLRSHDVYTGFRANTEGCFYVEGEGYVELENVLAYKPLPEPYREEFD